SGACDVGAGGDVSLAPHSIHIDGQADTGGAGGVGVTTGTIGMGKSGNIIMDTDSFLLENGATVQTTSSGTGDSGDIRLTAAFVRLDGHGSGGAFIGADTFFEGKCG